MDMSRISNARKEHWVYNKNSVKYMVIVIEEYWIYQFKIWSDNHLYPIFVFTKLGTEQTKLTNSLDLEALYSTILALIMPGSSK